MTRPTTITLSFLLVLLVIAGMYVKTQKLEPCLADSLATKPELISRLPYYAKAVDTGKWISKAGDIGDADVDGIPTRLTIDSIPNWFTEHSEIPTR